MAKKSFTHRLEDAVCALHENAGLNLISCRSRSLYSPVFRNKKYVWAKIMDSDGLFVARRKVHDGGEGRTPADSQGVSLLMGVVIQCEDSTSLSKANPFGKASLPYVPNGVWVDLEGQKSDAQNYGRRRLDRMLVVFVLPKGAAWHQRKSFETAKRNVENAAMLMPEAELLEMPRNTSSGDLGDELGEIIRPFLKGAGRPKGS